MSAGAGAGALRRLSDNPADAIRGILLVAASYVLLTLGDVASKWSLPVGGVALALLARGAAGTATCAAVSVMSGHGWRRLLPTRTGLVLLRAGLHSLVSLTYYLAWLSMTLADTYAVTFTAPLLMTLLAVPLLGERIRLRRIASTLVGFLGVLAMLRPGGGLFVPAVAILLPGVCGMAVSRIMARQLSTTETPECLTFWMMAAHVALGFVLLAWFPPAVPWAALPLLVLGAAVLHGVLNAGGHCLMAGGYALAPVAAVAPYEYTTLVWGSLLGWLVFAELPAPSTIAGAAVVAAAGLYNLHRERVRQKQETRNP